MLSFGAFFCWWAPILRPGVNQFSWFFQFLTVKAVLPEWKQVFCLVVFYSEQILCWRKPLFKLRSSCFQRVISLLLLETIFCGFLDVPASGRSISAQWKLNHYFTVSFILTDGIRSFVQWKNYSFIYSFFMLVETIICSKFRFSQLK